ncbi:MAG: 30S ribosomal protein S6 [Acidobacteriia bacterium]|nr:30S ribosomal protein S6 [Terriglobia bacterium]
MDRLYEIMFIVNPNLADEEVDKLIAQFETTVTSTHGEAQKVEKLGKRRLAYRVGRFWEGNYVLFTVKGGGDTVKELERRLKVTDAVLKYLTVRVDEDLKRLEKMKTKRAARAARKPARHAPPPASPPAPAAAPEPAPEVSPPEPGTPASS